MVSKRDPLGLFWWAGSATRRFDPPHPHRYSLGKRTRPARSLYDQGSMVIAREQEPGPSAIRNLLAGASAEHTSCCLRYPVDNKKSGTRIGRQHGPDPDADSTETSVRPLHYYTRKMLRALPICHYQVSTQAYVQFQSFRA